MVAILIWLSRVSYNFVQPWQNRPVSSADEVQIYVVNHGWHTGIILAGNQLEPELNFIQDKLGKHSFYEFGWGDKGFYQAKTITTAMTFNAILWPTDSVMHVVAFSQAPQEYFSDSEVLAMTISISGLRALNAGIAASFKKEGGGAVLPTRPGIYGNSLFFTGEGHYYATNTCNTWVAKMLAYTGAPFNSFLTLTSGGVMRQTKSVINKYASGR